MEVSLLSILSNYGDVGVLLMFLYWKSKQMETKHSEAVSKLDAMSMTSTNIEKQLAVFSVKLDHGDQRFVKLESDVQKLIENEKIIRERLHNFGNDLLSKDHVELIVEAKLSDKNK